MQSTTKITYRNPAYAWHGLRINKTQISEDVLYEQDERQCNIYPDTFDDVRLCSRIFKLACYRVSTAKISLKECNCVTLLHQ